MGRKGSGFTGQEIEEEEGGFGRVRKSSFLPGTTEQVRHHSKVTRRQTTGAWFSGDAGFLGRNTKTLSNSSSNKQT